YNNRCFAYHNINDYERAIRDCSRAIELNPNYALALDNRGRAYREKGDYVRAIEDYDALIRLQPKSSTAWNNRCWSRALEGHHLELALSDCNESLRLWPNNAHALDSRALTYLKLRKFDDAITDYSAALELQPKKPTSLYGRGIAKSRKGDAGGSQADIA